MDTRHSITGHYTVHYRYLPKITAILALHGHSSITGTFPRLQLYWPSMDTSPLQVPSQDYSYTGPPWTPWTLVHYRYLPTQDYSYTGPPWTLVHRLQLYWHSSITGTFPRLQLYWPSMDTPPLQVTFPRLQLYWPSMDLHGHSSITGTFPRLQLYWPSMDTSPLQLPSQDYSYTGPPWTLVHYRYLPKITAILALHGHSSITGTFPRLQLYWPSMDTSPLQITATFTSPLQVQLYWPSMDTPSITGTFPRLQLYWPSMDTKIPLQLPSHDYSYTGPPWTLVHYRYLPTITAILSLHGH